MLRFPDNGLKMHINVTRRRIPFEKSAQHGYQIRLDHKEIGLLPARIDSALSLWRHEEHQRADNTRG